MEILFKVLNIFKCHTSIRFVAVVPPCMGVPSVLKAEYATAQCDEFCFHT